MGWDNVITHMKYGERFRRHRKWMHDSFQTKASLQSYRPIQRRETYMLLSDLLAAPADFLAHINRYENIFPCEYFYSLWTALTPHYYHSCVLSRRWTAGIIMDITYGHRVYSLRDEYVTLVRETSEETVRAGSPGSMIVDFSPIRTLDPPSFVRRLEAERYALTTVFSQYSQEPSGVDARSGFQTEHLQCSQDVARHDGCPLRHGAAADGACMRPPDLPP